MRISESEAGMPYVRVALDRFQPDAGDEVLTRVRRGLLPLLRRQPGFVAYEVIKTGEDSAIFVHTCDSKEQAEAAVQTAATWVREQIADLIVSVDTHVGELAITSRTEQE